MSSIRDLIGLFHYAPIATKINIIELFLSQTIRGVNSKSWISSDPQN